MAEEGRIKLPERSTRGKRMRAQLDDEDAEADAEFWNQEFFAEDARDADYQSEKEEEDVVDSDFFESESEASDEEVEVRERKKKTLRPPGAPPGGSRPRPPKPQPQPKPKDPASSSPSAAAATAAGVAGAASDELPQSVIFEATYEAPSLRKSTRARVEEAQKERVQREQQAKATRRPARQTEFRVYTQEELLAEAARTELDNLASLKQLLAREEETKKRANLKKQRFGGPLIRSRSRTIQVLVPPEVAAQELQWQQQSTQQQQGQRRQQQQQAASTAAPAAAAAVDAAGAVKQEPDAAAGTAETAAADASAAEAAAGTDAAAAAKAPDEAVPMQVDQQQDKQEQPAAAQQQQQGPELPTGSTLQRQCFNTLQCLGMKAPKWLLPQRAPGAAPKPICPITGTAARYRDPLTGHYYSSAEAFRELRRRLGQPLPPPQPYRRLTATPAAELQALLGQAAAAEGAAGDAAAATAPVNPAAAAAAAAAGTSLQQAAALAAAAAGSGTGVVDGLPAGQLQLQDLVEKHVLQQLAVVGGKGKAKAYYQQQQPVPDEVAALVLHVSQMVHG
jgi:vacuolar protein sorting-associated protein 72